MNRLVLVRPSYEYQKQIVETMEEWSEYNATHDTNRSPGAIFYSDWHNFDEYLRHFDQQEHHPKEGHVPSTTYFALDKERNIMVGAISIRHYLNEDLRNGGGHIGDEIRPSERRKGYATEMISLALTMCRKLKIEKVMMSCNDYNIGSRKSIIKNGGVYEKTVLDDGENLEIYWIDLSK